MKKINMQKLRKRYISLMVTLSMMMTPVLASDAKDTITKNTMDDVVDPIVALLNSLMGPALGLVGALGSLYCVLLGVKFAKAEEPQEREKAKGNLKGAIIGFALIFILLLGLNLAMPVLKQWVIDNQVGGSHTTNIKF